LIIHSQDACVLEGIPHIQHAAVRDCDLTLKHSLLDQSGRLSNLRLEVRDEISARRIDSMFCARTFILRHVGIGDSQVG
jgi:hypothetical protein